MKNLFKTITVDEVIEKINSNENGIYAIEKEVGTGQINSLKEASDDEITVICSLMNTESLRELRKLGGTDKQVIILDEFDRASLQVKEELIKSLDKYKDSIVIFIRETMGVDIDFIEWNKRTWNGRIMEVGDVVILKIPALGNPIGTVGVCYEEYDLNGHKGASFIFENGNYDGFSENEQKTFLFLVDYDIITSEYIFSNVLRLNDDFYSGHFDNVFKLSNSEKLEYLKMLRESKIDSILD